MVYRAEVKVDDVWCCSALGRHHTFEVEIEITTSNVGSQTRNITL
jgi:hypothetical protein